jgi:putative SOS response-associated peptidase YedK
MPFAGLWDRSVKSDGSVIESFAIITVPANELLSGIHSEKRMPAILHLDDVYIWLTGSAEEAKAALVQFPEERLRAHKVSTRVSSPKIDDESLMQPV